MQTTPKDGTTRQWTVLLDNSKELMADIYVSAAGVSPNNQFTPWELSADGWATIDDHFRVAEAKCITYTPSVTSLLDPFVRL